MSFESKVPDEVVQAVREAGERDTDAFRANTEQSLMKVRARIERERLALPATRRIPRWVPALAAASVLVLLGYEAVRRQQESITSVAEITYHTARGEQKTFSLPDGSEMILGPSSTVRFGNGSMERRVTLDGQGYFRVRHNAAIPFVVAARNAVATDIGTEFAVRAYPEDSAVHVAVAEGVVNLAMSGKLQDGRVLNKGSVGTVLTENIYTGVGDVSSYTSWTSKKLVFENATLPKIANELSRWFDVDVTVDPGLATRRLSAVYDKPTLNEVLDAIAATTGARVQRNGNTVRLEAVR